MMEKYTQHAAMMMTIPLFANGSENALYSRCATFASLIVCTILSLLIPYFHAKIFSLSHWPTPNIWLKDAQD